MNQKYIRIKAFNLSDRTRSGLEALRLAIFFALVGYFIFTLFALFDSFGRLASNAERYQDGRLLRTALAEFKSDNGHYPVLIDRPYDRLSADLVDLKYLRKLPIDPSGTYRYASDGSYYGLVLNLQPVRWTPMATTGGPCLIGVNARGPEWDTIPVCRLD